MENSKEVFDTIYDDQGQVIPGVYYNLPAKIYHKIPNAFGSTALKTLVNGNVDKLLHSLTNPTEVTSFMLKGTLFHFAMESMEKFEEAVERDYAIQPMDIKRNNKVGQEWEAIYAVGKEIIKAQDFDDIRGMVEKARCDNFVKHIMSGGQPEVSVIAPDPVTGVMLKGRVDWMYKKDNRINITDFKTMSKDVYPEYRIARQVEDSGWHIQLAEYGDTVVNAFKALGETVEIAHYYIVCIESTAPYSVYVWELGENSVARGRMLYQDGLSDYKAYLDRVKEYGTAYGGYPRGMTVKSIEIPSLKYKN